ncbi:MAG: hypothetical protein R3F14_47505, partial [Polyangiaceae bacterium]
MSPPIELAIGDRGPRWFLIAFLVTQLIEVPIYERALRERHSAPATRDDSSDLSPTAAEAASPTRARPSAEVEPSQEQGISHEQGASERAREVRRWGWRVGVAFGASAITHPVVWFAMPTLAIALLRVAAWTGPFEFSPELSTTIYGLLAEGFAVTVEALYLRAFGVRRPLLWSVIANASSV